MATRKFGSFKTPTVKVNSANNNDFVISSKR